MRGLPIQVRVRAWLMRRFKGRPRSATPWADVQPLSAGPPAVLRLGDLVVAAAPVGVNPGPVFEVRVTLDGDSRAWSSRYGLPEGAAGAVAAADIGLDDLYEAFSAPAAWTAAATAGMSEAEAEAIVESPAVRLDLRAASWIGPHLEQHIARRRSAGTWFGPGSA